MIRNAALLPAIAGYLFTYYNSKKTDERKAQIDRINSQVRELYGPLLACLNSTKSAYAAMVRQHAPDGTLPGFLRAIHDTPNGPEGEAYRHWMRAVLQPLNEKAADIIVNHVDLLESTNINPLLLQFVAHVSAYRVILKRWEEGAVQEWSAVSYPDKLPEYVEQEFRKLKRKQAELLGIKSSTNAPTTTTRGDGGSTSSSTHTKRLRHQEQGLSSEPVVQVQDVNLLKTESKFATLQKPVSRL